MGALGRDKGDQRWSSAKSKVMCGMQDRNRRLEAFQRSSLGPREVTPPGCEAERDNERPAVRGQQFVKPGKAD
jgi:hypothetical protein